MTKKKSKREQIKGVVETALEFGIVKVNGREINVWDEQILSKPQKNKNRHKDPLTITVPLTEKVSKIPQNYTLANLPVYNENQFMQEYHFYYTKSQLKEMYTTPKIIVDTWHSTFITDEGVVHRTSFFAVAPNANVKNGIPQLYRFSITRCDDKTEHYTMNMHAIVGGKEDGWLFLARLDNNTAGIYHPVLKNNMTRAYLKQHNAVVTKSFTYKQLRQKSKLKGASNPINRYEYCIPFPHIHQADPHYEIGTHAEKICPKFLRKCAYNNFEQNLAFMMKIFRISDKMHLRDENENLYKIIKDEQKIKNINPEPNAKELYETVLQLEEENYNEQPTPVAVSTKDPKPRYFHLQRHRIQTRYM